MKAPIILFAYNRPQHTRRALASLLRNAEVSQSKLYAFSDGPRTEADADAVAAVRRVLHAVQGFAGVEIVERQDNWGLARNIIDGVTAVVNRHGRVIVIEDDLVVAPHFLQFMNDALELYADEPRVGHIQACDFTRDATLPDTFLIKFTGSWGWATWARAWRLFNADGADLLCQLRERRLTRTFDFNGRYPFTRMLRRQVEGKNNSWAIRWNASLFLADVLSLNVGRSLVSNEGFDGSGTHCGTEDCYTSSLYMQPLPVRRIEPIEENQQARLAFQRYYARTNSLWARIIRRLKRPTPNPSSEGGEEPLSNFPLKGAGLPSLTGGVGGGSWSFRTELLLGDEAMGRLASKRVIVFGVGGVGSWCAESLVRSGIRSLTIVDPDLVSPTNINRQLMATTQTVGRPKVEVLRERLLTINPAAEITALQQSFTPEAAADFGLCAYDYVVDAIDSLRDKAHLILMATAQPPAPPQQSPKLFSSMGAALKLDPTRIRVAEFWRVQGDPLARALRNRFRRDKTFPRRKFQCVFSDELLHNRKPIDPDDRGNGTIVHITATFGFMLAGLVIQDAISHNGT